MATPINMPQVGQDIEFARIIEWHVKEGKTVAKGDILATVESDKASFEVESSTDGIVLKILYNEGEEAPVFQPIIFIGETGEVVSDNQSDLNSHCDKKIIPAAKRKEISYKKGFRIFSTPSARRVARENNIDFRNIKGTGPEQHIVKADVLREIERIQRSERITPLAKSIANQEGIDIQSIPGSGSLNRILKSDIETILSPKKSAPLLPGSSDKVIRFIKTKQRIADKLSLSKQTIPHFYLFADIDFTTTLKWRSNVNLQNGSKISVNDIILKATADTLSQFPQLNAHVDHEKMLIKANINIGVAVTTEHGLFVPVIPEANLLSLIEIHYISQKNAMNARRGVVNPTVPATFTVSNLGMVGISRFLPIINPPECAILSVGAIEKKAAVVKDQVAVIDGLTLGIACDHRAVDGAYAAGFISALKINLENFSN